jgi:hypothetical protein
VTMDMNDFTDFFDGPEDSSLVLQRPTCPIHFIELPVTRICEECS